MQVLLKLVPSSPMKNKKLQQIVLSKKKKNSISIFKHLRDPWKWVYLK